ncbi:MAG: NADP-dependent isocitrate dehydrogenase, partial [Paraglaciecola sp.]|nr:NADP-dependent isocitrate dehydrogenase [Paraglaciecola sp.]
HLRWDSLGEFLALAVSLEDLAIKTKNTKAKLLAATLDKATEKLLTNNKSPLRRAGELDNRGSHFYLALYWAEALSLQSEDAELAKTFAPVFASLSSNEAKIMSEIDATQGKPAEIGGYYYPDEKLATEALFPSSTFKAALAFN